MQSAIFDEFRRGDDAPGQGLGLGLSIAERIAQLLDAPLILRSKPDGSSRPDHSMLDQGSRVGGAPSHGTVLAVRVVRVGVPAPVPGGAVQAVRGGSEDRRGGEGCVSTGRYRLSQYNS